MANQQPSVTGASADPAPEFVCPLCGISSQQSDDGRNGYCGACHAFTGAIEPIDGGFRVRLAASGTHYLDVLAMFYGLRLVTTPVDLPETYDRGWCYFATGVDADGKPRTRRTALLAAVAAAWVWDGSEDTEPPGSDRRAV